MFMFILYFNVRMNAFIDYLFREQDPFIPPAWFSTHLTHLHLISI